MKILRARLYEVERERATAEASAARLAQIGTGERSEKIRTYNFPQNRVTDHRIGLTVHNLEAVLAGDLSEFTDALAAEEQAPPAGGRRRVIALAEVLRRSTRTSRTGAARPPGWTPSCCSPTGWACPGSSSTPGTTGR